MSTLDLRSADGLRTACLQIEQAQKNTPAGSVWVHKLQNFLASVAEADRTRRASVDFQQTLWNDNPLSSPGQGNIPVETAIESAMFRRWLAQASMQTLPEDASVRLEVLTRLYQEIIARLKAHQVTRTPHLKILRLLAAFFPDHFTTLADRGKLRKLNFSMGGPSTDNPIAWHQFVRARIDAVVPDTTSLVWRMAIPWCLYVMLDAEQPEAERVVRLGPLTGEEHLLPLPAARRRRGLTAIKGSFQTLLSVLEVVKEGTSREELLDYLRTTHPQYKESTLRVLVNILRSEFAVIRLAGNQYQLTDRGVAVLESNDAAPLGDWLITRILGVDHVLAALSGSSQPRSALLTLLRRVHPGWTSMFAPDALLNWLLSLGAIEPVATGNLSLTPLGQQWASLIDWDPEYLPEETDAAARVPEVTLTLHNGNFPRPPLESIRAALDARRGDSRETLKRLHLGLWAPERRHLAVLAGISGSGKTRIATEYGEALTGTPLHSASSRVYIEAVQPAWYDPAPLLGYVSPLKDASYTRTGFLDFLLRASLDPTRPYVAILDEMNLSHPEQYLAPLLSAMETGGAVRFHSEGETFDGIPGSILYPPNLAIIGTINMDETTHGLSDKVLDRAFTLEFSAVEMSDYPGWAGRTISAATRSILTAVLSELLDALRPVRLNFGWRVVDDVVDFVTLGEQESGSGEVARLLDYVISAKVLPKLRGDDSPAFKTALQKIQDTFARHGLSQSNRRVEELAKDLRASGSARFWR